MAKKLRKRIKKFVKKGKNLARKAWKDPLTQEYVGKQKKLAKRTLKKAVRRAEKRYRL